MWGFTSITTNILTQYEGDIMKLKDKKIGVLAGYDHQGRRDAA
jgi:hypothetical protein